MNTLLEDRLATESRPWHFGQRPRTAFPQALRGLRPDWFLVLMLVAMALSSICLIEPAPVDAAMLGLFAAGLVLGRLRLKPLPDYAFILMSVFTLANLISMWDARDEVRAGFYVFVTVYMLLSWILFSGLLNRYGTIGMEYLMKGYVFAALLSSILAMLSYFHIIGFQDYLLLNARLKGLFKDPNVFGPFLIPVALYALTGLLAYHKKTWFNRAWQTAVALTLVVGIVLSFSRACWINFMVSTVVFYGLTFLVIDPKSLTFRKVMSGALVLALAGIGLLAALQIPSMQKMMVDRMGQGGLKNYDQDRFETHRKAEKSVIEHPLGIGPGQAELVFNYATHSTYWRILSENGPIAFLAFVAFIVLSMIRSLWLAKKAVSRYWRTWATIAFACLCGMLINSGVVDTIHWRHFYFLLAIPWIAHPDVFSPDRVIGGRRRSSPEKWFTKHGPVYRAVQASTGGVAVR